MVANSHPPSPLLEVNCLVPFALPSPPRPLPIRKTFIYADDINMPAASVGHNKNLAGDARIRSGDPQKRDTWPLAKPTGMQTGLRSLHLGPFWKSA
jgi:hypothetical protein